MTNILELEVTDSLLLKASEDSVLVKAKTLNHLKRVLAREKKGSLTLLFKRIGVGFTAQQFDELVRVLVVGGFCTITVGERGAVILVLNEGDQP